MKTHFQSLFKNLTIFIASSWLFYSCVSVYTPNNTNTNTNTNTNKTTNVVKVVSNFPENFDQVSKNKYETTITTNSGDWYFENAMMGSTDNDVKNGAKAIRIKEDGLVRFDTDLTSGIYQIKLKAGLYQSDKTAAFEVRISTNRGILGTKLVTRSH
jgi:endonuclease G